MGQVFVSPTGKDSNLGTERQPVATLRRAVELSRLQPPLVPRQILLQPGAYYDAGAEVKADARDRDRVLAQFTVNKAIANDASPVISHHGALLGGHGPRGHVFITNTFGVGDDT